MTDDTEIGNGSGRRILIRHVIAGSAVMVVAAFAAILWYVYDEGINKGATLAPPLIKAPTGANKIKPSEPGGMRVPDQDKRVYETMEKAPDKQQSEYLLPPTETPKSEPEVAPKDDAAGVRITGSDGPKMPARPVARISEAPLPDAPAGGAASVDAAPAAGATPEPDATPAENPSAEKPSTETQTAAVRAPKPVAPPATAPSPKPGDYAVQLGSYRSREAAERGWSKISTKNAGQLDGLGHRVIEVDLGKDKGIFFRLQAISGAFANRVAPQMICDQLKARKQGCLVVKQ